VNPPYHTQHPETVFTKIGDLVDEVRLIALDPLIRVGLAYMPVELSKLADEVVSTQALVSLRAYRYVRAESGLYVCCAWIAHLT